MLSIGSVIYTICCFLSLKMIFIAQEIYKENEKVTLKKNNYYILPQVVYKKKIRIQQKQEEPIIKT